MRNTQGFPPDPRFPLESVTEVTLRCLLFALLGYAMYENVHFSFRLSIFASVGNSEFDK